MGDKWLNAKFDKDMNSMKLHRPLKIFKLLGKQLVDFEKKNLLFLLKVVLEIFLLY